MTDREMLEFAAKAAGIESGGGLFWCPATGNAWNPIADDGDALRLMVKLGLRVRKTSSSIEIDIYEDGSWVDVLLENIGDDPLAATRRAIVRAAAEIGKDME